MTGEGFPVLVDLVDRGLIRILDLRFVRRDADGSIQLKELTELKGQGILTDTESQAQKAKILGS
jgi:hypothetical protein